MYCIYIVVQSIREELMKMIQLVNRMILYCTLLAVVSIASVAVAAEDQSTSQRQEGVHEQENSKWGEAGQEVKKASGAVVEASRETAGSAWEKSADALEKARAGSKEVLETVGEKSKEAVGTVKEQSKYFWEKAWMESRHVWEEGKSKIHEVTAPTPPTPPAKSVASPPTAPVEPTKPATSMPAQ